MDSLVVCIIIFALSLISFALNKIPIALTSLLTLMALVLTGCLDGEAAIATFGNSNAVIMVTMCVVASGFGRTSFVGTLVNSIVRISKGSFMKAWVAYVILASILANVMSAPMVAFSVVCPLAAELVKGYKISPSKVMFPLLVVCVGCCGILPLANAVAAAAQYTGYLSAYNFTGYSITAMDFTISRWPIFLLIVLWAIFLGPKQCIDKPAVEIEDIAGSSDRKKLGKFSEAMGVIIFFVTILLLICSDAFGLTPWKITMTAALLMVLCGVLTEKEAIGSMNLPTAFIYVGAMGMATALGNTGAGELIGDLLANIVGGSHNSYFIGYLFFIVAFVLTQLMFNTGVMSIFIPIALLTCQSLGGNPVGLVLLVYSGALTAFLTPMATPAISLCMAAGGYDFKALLKQGWLITILLIIVYPFYIMTMYPIF